MSASASTDVVTVANLPYRLLLEHTDTMSAMALGGLRSILPLKPPAATGTLNMQVKPPSAELLTAYRRWCHAREQPGIPPHLVCARITMPLVAKLTARSPYPLLSVLNQGVRLQIHQPLPETETILLSGDLLEAADDGYRARIHSRIRVGTASVPQAMTIDAIAAVMLKKRPEASRERPLEEPVFATIGRWQARADEGQTFFWLTGDFNPIHTVPLLARRTRFKGCIMHGYGAFAQVFETLQRHGYRFNDIEARFVRPLPLPSPPLLIQAAVTPDAQGKIAFRLVDESGVLYQAGSFVSLEESAA